MKVYLDSIGCRLNQSEIETYARQFRAAGHTIVSDPGEADWVVINTCDVTAAAASDSRQKIRQAARAGEGKIIATGCWVTLNPEAALALPQVGQVVQNIDKDNLVTDLLQVNHETFELEPMERELIPGNRSRTRAFIKVQDGCDNRCTFCITTLARGSGRSRLVEQVTADIHAVQAGETARAREIVLTGVHLGSWGHDLNPRQNITQLVKELLDHTAIEPQPPRLRLSSLEPWDLEPSFFDLWQDPRLCRHLHLPLQSGCAATLRRMARKTTPSAFADLLAAARAAIPGLAVTTDIITGFPGETEAEFSESLAFVRQMQFAGGHPFTYSARPGTAAAQMPGQVPNPVRKERNARMRAVLEESAARYRRSFIGQQLPVLWEGAPQEGSDGWNMHGLTDNYLRVYTRSARPLWNRITPVLLTGLAEDGLYGTAVRG